MSAPPWQPTAYGGNGPRRYDRRDDLDQMGRQTVTYQPGWQQNDPARALRQRYAEVHGITPAQPAAGGTTAAGPAIHDAAVHQRALQLGLEMMRREAEHRATQAAMPPQPTPAMTPMHLPMGGGTPAAAAADMAAIPPSTNSPSAGQSTSNPSSPRAREDSPPRSDTAADEVTWNERSLRVLDDLSLIHI